MKINVLNWKTLTKNRGIYASGGMVNNIETVHNAHTHTHSICLSVLFGNCFTPPAVHVCD